MKNLLAGVRVALLADASVVHARLWGEGLANRGARVELFSLEPPRPELEAGPLLCHRLPALPLPGALRYPAALPALRRAVGAFDPHLLDAHFLPNYGLLGALLGRRPLVANAWGSDLLLARGFGREARVRFVLGRADRLFVDAQVARDRAIALGAPAARIVHLPWGVDTRLFAFGGSAAERRSRRRSWPASWLEESTGAAFVALSNRYLHPVYDVATALRGWAESPAPRAGGVLLVAGDGPQGESLRGLAHALGLAASVRFLGRVSAGEMVQLLRGADLYLSTSLSDTTSISLLEAMSTGALPVVSDLPANRQWVDEETAEIFPAGDAAGLARALERARERGEAVEAARQILRERVVARGDREAALDRVATLYRQLLDGQDPARPSESPLV